MRRVMRSFKRSTEKKTIIARCGGTMDLDEFDACLRQIVADLRALGVTHLRKPSLYMQPVDRLGHPVSRFAGFPAMPEISVAPWRPHPDEREP